MGRIKSANHMANSSLSESSASLERTTDSISILGLVENSEVSILIPHSVAASHTMVSA